jgi:hypothetical protein
MFKFFESRGVVYAVMVMVLVLLLWLEQWLPLGRLILTQQAQAQAQTLPLLL